MGYGMFMFQLRGAYVERPEGEEISDADRFASWSHLYISMPGYEVCYPATDEIKEYFTPAPARLDWAEIERMLKPVRDQVRGRAQVYADQGEPYRELLFW